MQRVVKRSDATSVVPPNSDDDRATNEVLRFVLGVGCDEDPEEDLYETLISKGLVEKNQRGRKSCAVDDDSLTASCTESYSSSWSTSLHDSFGQEGTLPQHYQPSPQPHSSPFSNSVTGSPRRRRTRRGSFDRSAMMTVDAPPLTVGKSSHESSSAPATTAAAPAATSATAQPRARAPRRRHGSFLESSSTSCCLNDIVEETEHTESSAAAPVDVDGDGTDVVALSSSADNHGDFPWSGRRVKFGSVEIRSYAVTLDHVGGYGLEGKPVLCPLTLDWQYDEANVVRKPAILFGYTSYFQQVRLRPTTVDVRRARLGILHNLRQPQVRRWEYKALLHQMAALHSSGHIPDRWQEQSDDDELETCVVMDDRVPSEPVRRSADDGGTDSLCDAVGSPCKLTSMELPSKRGIDMPIVPMQWIDHNSHPESEIQDSWRTLDPVWLDVQPIAKKIAKPDKVGPSGRHCMPTMPSLWLHEPPQVVDSIRGASDEVNDAEFIHTTDFHMVPFEPLVTSRIQDSVLASSTVRLRTKDWKRSPPGRSNVKRLSPDGIPTAAAQSTKSPSAASPMPRLPFLWLRDESLGRDASDSPIIDGGGDSLPDADVESCSREFRKVPFEDLVTVACARPTGFTRSGRRSATGSRSQDEVEWRRCVDEDALLTDDRSLESLTWLEELANLGRSRRAPVPESVPTVVGAAEELKRTVMNSTEAHACTPPKANPGKNSSVVSERVTRAEESTSLRKESVRDGICASSSEPTSVAGMLHPQPLMCLYQDVTRIQVQPSKQTAGKVPFVWLPAPAGATRKGEGR